MQFSIVVVAICIPSIQGIYNSSIYSQLLPHDFDYSNSNRCEVTFHCGFDLHFLDDQQCLAHYSVPIGHVDIFSGKMCIQVFFHILIGFYFRYLDIYIYIYIHTHTHIHIYIYMYTYMYTHTYMGIYTYIFINHYQIYGLKIVSPIPQVAFSIYCFLCCAEVFQFGVVSLIYFNFCCLCFWYLNQKIIAKTNYQEAFPLWLFQ